MAFKLIEITTPEERLRAIVSIAEKMEMTDVQIGPSLGDGRRLIRLSVGEVDRQSLHRQSAYAQVATYAKPLFEDAGIGAKQVALSSRYIRGAGFRKGEHR